MAFVIGRRCKDVEERKALECVAGYTLLNDLSARDLQFATPQWMPGKVFDGSAPCGPALVTPDEAGAHDAIEIALTLNGEAMQSASTNDLIFSVPALVRTFEPDDAGTRRHRVDRNPVRGRQRARAARLAEARRRAGRQLAHARAARAYEAGLAGLEAFGVARCVPAHRPRGGAPARAPLARPGGVEAQAGDHRVGVAGFVKTVIHWPGPRSPQRMKALECSGLSSRPPPCSA